MRVWVAEDGKVPTRIHKDTMFLSTTDPRSDQHHWFTSVQWVWLHLLGTVLCLMSQGVIKSNTAESVEDGEKGARLIFSIKVRIRIRLVGVTCKIVILCLGK